MSRSLHEVFVVVFGNVYFFIVVFNNHGRKGRFFESSQNYITGKSVFGHLEVIFLNVYIFSGRGWLFSVSTCKEKYFIEKMISLAGLKKICLISRKCTDFGTFLAT